MMLGIKEKSSNSNDKNVNKSLFIILLWISFILLNHNLFGSRTTYIYTVSPIFKSIYMVRKENYLIMCGVKLKHIWKIKFVQLKFHNDLSLFWMYSNMFIRAKGWPSLQVLGTVTV